MGYEEDEWGAIPEEDEWGAVPEEDEWGAIPEEDFGAPEPKMEPEPEPDTPQDRRAGLLDSFRQVREESRRPGFYDNARRQALDAIPFGSWAANVLGTAASYLPKSTQIAARAASGSSYAQNAPSVPGAVAAVTGSALDRAQGAGDLEGLSPLQRYARIRAANEKRLAGGREDHPISTGIARGGAGAGSLLLPFGAVARGAKATGTGLKTAARLASRGAAAGAGAGAGLSGAKIVDDQGDLSSEELPQLLTSAGAGAAFGGIGGPVAARFPKTAGAVGAGLGVKGMADAEDTAGFVEALVAGPVTSLGGFTNAAARNVRGRIAKTHAPIARHADEAIRQDIQNRAKREADFTRQIIEDRVKARVQDARDQRRADRAQEDSRYLDKRIAGEQELAKVEEDFAQRALEGREQGRQVQRGYIAEDREHFRKEFRKKIEKKNKRKLTELENKLADALADFASVSEGGDSFKSLLGKRAQEAYSYATHYHSQHGVPFDHHHPEFKPLMDEMRATVERNAPNILDFRGRTEREMAARQEAAKAQVERAKRQREEFQPEDPEKALKEEEASKPDKFKRRERSLDASSRFDKARLEAWRKKRELRQEMKKNEEGEDQRRVRARRRTEDADRRLPVGEDLPSMSREEAEALGVSSLQDVQEQQPRTRMQDGVRTLTDKIAEKDDWYGPLEPLSPEVAALKLPPAEARLEQALWNKAKHDVDTHIQREGLAGAWDILRRTVRRNSPRGWEMGDPAMSAIRSTRTESNPLGEFADPRIAKIVNERMWRVKDRIPGIFEGMTPQLGVNISVPQLLILLRDPAVAAVFEGTDEQED